MINFDYIEANRQQFRSQFLNAKPFPHIGIDGLCDEAKLTELYNSIPEIDTHSADYIFAKEKYEKSKYKQLGGVFEELHTDLTSERFKNWLCYVTGENVFIANHPLGNIDGMAYFSILSRYFKKIRSISNALLQHFPNIDELYVPVDILNERSKESLLGVDRLYREPGQIIHFPAGAVSRDIDGVIKDLPWKKSFVNKSIEYQRTIVPVFIHEQNSKFFYRLSRLRMFLGIKRPIELFYLVDEMFKKRNITLRFTIGTPIPASRLTKDKRPQEWCEIIRAYTYSLATNPDAKF